MTETDNLGMPRNKKLVIVLAALFAITLVGLNIAITAYYSEMNTKNSQIKQLNDQLNSIQAQIANLTLTSPAPNLISVGFNYIDNTTKPSAPFLQVTGYVVNVGTAKANSCALHMYAIQNGNITCIDTSLAINSLDPGAYEIVNVKFPYTGQPLIAYSSSLNWK
jgi:hypothetical protein